MESVDIFKFGVRDLPLQNTHDGDQIVGAVAFKEGLDGGLGGAVRRKTLDVSHKHRPGPALGIFIPELLFEPLHPVQCHRPGLRPVVSKSMGLFVAENSLINEGRKLNSFEKKLTGK